MGGKSLRGREGSRGGLVVFEEVGIRDVLSVVGEVGIRTVLGVFVGSSRSSG